MSIGADTILAQGTYDRPFNAKSIWNLPIGSGAKYVPAGFSKDRLTAFSDSMEGINRFSPSDPIRTAYKKKVWNGASCDPSNIDTSIIVAKIRIPDSFLWSDNLTDGGRSAFVMPDNSGEHLSGSTAVKLSEGDVVELYGFERCTPGGPAAAYTKSTLPHSIYGDGYPSKGMHLGSYLSVLGGEVRSGELISPAGVEIPHTLKVALPATEMYYNPNDSTPGYVWPAQVADSYAKTDFTGANPLVEVGSLFAIPPSFDCRSLKTEPGWKICRAMQKYGAYVADTNRKGTFKVRFQIISPSNKIVRTEMQNVYGIDTSYIPNDPSSKNQATKDFKSDMDTIWEKLMVISNTSPSYPKGPGGTSTLPAPPRGLQIAPN